ncbi:MAG: hypothetical protein ACRC4X_05345 [Cetobacterium sp.]
MSLQNAINRQNYQQYFRAGNYYSLALVQSAQATSTQAANIIRAWPWIVSKPVTFNEVRLEISTLVAATQVRVGIYNDTGLIYPGTLITGSDPGLFDSATTGVKTLAIPTPFLLQPNLYWLAVTSNGAPLCRSVAVAAIAPVLGVSNAMGTNGINTNYSVGQVFGALPATFPGGATTQSNNTCPAAIWRAA